jgi:hypothetical protein
MTFNTTCTRAKELSARTAEHDVRVPRLSHRAHDHLSTWYFGQDAPSNRLGECQESARTCKGIWFATQHDFARLEDRSHQRRRHEVLFACRGERDSRWRRDVDVMTLATS